MLITPNSGLYYLVQFLIVGNLLALLVGVMMLAAPKRLAKFFKLTDRWISTRRLTKPLEVPRRADQAMLRYPRVLGAILLASAALILIKGIIFISSLSVHEGGLLLARFYRGTNLSNQVWEVLWLALIILISLGAVLALIVGVLSIFKTRQLRHWADTTTRWVSTRRLTKPLEVPHYPLDKMVRENPKLWGGTITALAFFSVMVLWWFIRHNG
ncbi:MAG: hypothetical protein HY081_07990 [Gammaproteobacteria bacterium]|nr:hypothetical protein [Gammaproteobacteria bacterium]